MSPRNFLKATLAALAFTVLLTGCESSPVSALSADEPASTELTTSDSVRTGHARGEANLRARIGKYGINQKVKQKY